MTRTVQVVALCAGLSAVAAKAGPYDGVYVTRSGEGVDRSGCAAPDILIAADNVRYFDVRCTLSNPVRIRAMEALLFDGRCSLDGTLKEGRVLIRRMASGDIALVTPFMDVRLAACEVAG